MGRTHGVHAEPTTFGLKLAGWAFALDRDRERLERALEGLRVGKLSGAVGTVRGHRPRGRARSRASGSASSRRRARRRSSSATATPSCSRRSRCSRRRSTVRDSRSATSRAPRCARSRSRSAAARRARRRCRTSATRSSPSASAGSRASCGRTRSSASRTSRSGTSATSRTRPPSGSCCPTRSSPSTTCSTASPGSSRGSSCARSGCARTSTSSHGLFFSQRLLLALVESRAHARRRLPARAAQRDAGVGRGARLPRARRRRRRDRRPRRPRRGVRPRARTRAHVDVVFDRLRALVATREARGPCLSGRRTLGERQGARDLRARRRPAAARRLATGSRRSTSSCRRRSPTRAGCSPACRRSGSRARATIVPNHLLELGADGRSHRAAGGSRCCRSSSSCAATCPARAGSTTATSGVGLRPRVCRPGCASPSGCPSRS